MDLEWWINERTFHHSQFGDLNELVELKKRQGLTISLCLPTLNEANTIGREIKIIRHLLVKKYPLVDEICVVDSGSTDRTRQRARRAGAKVFLAEQTLPELGSYKGKGENLWKSLYLTKGDIIIWVDADIRNFHPRFVYGLIGPLLQNPGIEYVKSFYRRPLKVGHRVLPGGGRVTELMVRPFLNLLFPDLALLAQPLSGEYAGRRSLLEQVPFFTGYGVEIGLLIDIEQRFGMQVIAQVDMDVRIHQNQAIENLRKMSYVILSILLHRSEQLGKIALLERMGHQLHLLRRGETGYVYDAEDIGGRERPPMLSISAYQERYGLQPDDAALVEAYQLPSTGRSCFSLLPNENFVHLELNGRTREAVIRELLALPAAQLSLISPEKIVQGLLSRETRLSSNLGHGVAIPHIVTDQLEETLILFGRSARGVDFRSSIIKRPVYLIFIILSPQQRQAEYLQILTCLARLLRHRKVIQNFREVSTPTEAIVLMKKYDALINLQTQLKLRLLI